MLSNKHKYSLNRFKKVLLSIPITFVAPFVARKPLIVLTSSLNMVYEDNSRALFESLYADPRFKNRVYFVLNDKEKREELNQHFPGCFIGNTKWSDLKIILSAKYWFSSSLELPAPGFFNSYLRKSYHLGHGMPFKKAGLAEAGVSWYKRLYYKLTFTNFSYVWCTLPLFKEEVCKTYGVSESKIKLLPQPKTATIAKHLVTGLSEFDKIGSKHVLYAPTWRPYGNTQLFPFADVNLIELDAKLKELNIFIWLRIHPRFYKQLNMLTQECSNIKEFSATCFSDVNYYLMSFDALITDYSSLYYDFLNLGRPVWFFDYDLDEYSKVIGVIDQYNDYKVSLSTTSQEMFIQQLVELKNEAFETEPILEMGKKLNHPEPLEGISQLIISELFAADKDFISEVGFA